jgi:uncharacterized protein
MIRPFHLAFPVRDVAEATRFYTEVLGCSLGRASEHWQDFDFFGHQLVAHLAPDECQPVITNEVDHDQVPCRHFGVILSWDAWHHLRDRLLKHGVHFLIQPHIRFKGAAGEQATMFFQDPSGNALEFKAFQDDSSIFKV